MTVLYGLTLGLQSQLQRQLLRTEITSASQQVLHGQAIETFNKLVELRRQRIERISGSVPGVLWGRCCLG